MKDRRGVIGLNVVRAVMIFILVIAIIGVATIITLVSIRDVAEKVDRVTVSLTNDTTLSEVNETGISLVTIAGIDASGILDCTLSPTIVTVANATASIISADNWVALSNCSIASEGGAFDNNGTNWNITGAFTYSPRNTRSIQGNISSATSDFFGNTGTFFAILVVVVIILAIAIIITVVSGFGGGRIGGGRGAGAGSITGI